MARKRVTGGIIENLFPYLVEKPEKFNLKIYFLDAGVVFQEIVLRKSE